MCLEVMCMRASRFISQNLHSSHVPGVQSVVHGEHHQCRSLSLIPRGSRTPAPLKSLLRRASQQAVSSSRKPFATQCSNTQTGSLLQQSVTVRPAMLSELDDIAWLRAEAFYEDQPHLRYVGSFKRQFKEQEARSLRDRTRHRQGQAGPDCVCLVAVKEDESSQAEVIGTLDVEPPGSALAQSREGVPADCTYVLNVVVSSKHRGQGIGSILMAAAAGMAREDWACSTTCAHVSAQNDAAIALYKACGYQEALQEIILHDESAAGESLLGKKLFMVATT